MKRKIILIIILIGLVFSACSRPSKEDIIGYWIENENTCSSNAISDCASIVFYPDGSAEFSNFDFDLFSEEDEKINFIGSWSLELSEDPLRNSLVIVDIGPNEVFPTGRGLQLFILLGSNDHITYGLPDDAHITFEKIDALEP